MPVGLKTPEPGTARAPVALLLIDVINDLEFPEGGRAARHARADGASGSPR